MLESDRDARPSAAQLLQHPFITGYQCSAQCSSPCSVLPALADAAAYVTVFSSVTPQKGGLELLPPVGAQRPRAEDKGGLDVRLEGREDSLGVESRRGVSVSTVATSPEGSCRPADSLAPLECGGWRLSRILSEQVRRLWLF